MSKIETMTFCCERFRGRWETESDKAISIRIMKLKEDQVINFKFPIRCFIMSPYQPNDIHIQFLPIFYCPYCGADLLKVYNDEKYVNEDGEIIRSKY